MDAHQAATLSAAEHARLDSYMVAIATEARGNPQNIGSGEWRFGHSGGLCLHPDGQFHDFTAGRHGHGAYELLRYLHPDVDAVAFARDLLARHSGMGSFVPSEDTREDEAVEDEIERTAYIAGLLEGGLPIDDTPAKHFITQTRKLPLPPEVAAQLRWIPLFRGEEGVLVLPYTDDDGKLCALGVTHITPDGQKSLHAAARQIFRGVRGWHRRALLRLGKPSPAMVETEGFEKGLAALAGGAEYVVVTGGVSRFGLVEPPTLVKRVVIPRDDDPPGSLADQALWRGVVRRLGQGLDVAVTARPNTVAPKDAPPLKDLDDVWRYDHDLVSVLLKGASLEHGRLGEAADNAILDAASRLDAVALSRARKGVATLLRISVTALDAELNSRFKGRLAEAKAEEPALPGQSVTFSRVDPWPDPVDGAELLSEISDTFAHYVRVTKSERDVLALGVVHGHAWNLFDIMPIFALTSPQPRSGKTRLMRLMARTAPKALLIGGSTAAFLTRAIDLAHPNIFADEYDTIMKGDPEKAEMFRGILNTLFDRESAFVGKCVATEDGPVPRLFSVWSPLWLAGLKGVPPTIEDRAHHIQLRRKRLGEKVKSLRLRDGPEFDIFKRKAARFVADNERALREANPDCPEALAEHSDRAADAWSPLFAIAQVAGGGWLARAHTAALVLVGVQDAAGAKKEVTTDKDDELALLVDIRTTVIAVDALAPDADELGKDKQIAVKALTTARALADAGQAPAKPPRITLAIGGAQLALALGSTDLFPDRRWSEWEHGRPIKSHHIIAVLREYGIELKSVRVPGTDKFLWGFSRAALDDAFSRYVSSPRGYTPGEQKSASRPHSTEIIEENTKNGNPHGPTGSALKNNGGASNSAGFEGERRAETAEAAVSSAFSDESLTRQNLSPEDPKLPHTTHVGVPKGAIRRRGIGEPK